MRRFWPLVLALFCWIVVLAVPATRRGVVEAWDNHESITRDATKKVDVPPFKEVSLSAAELLRRFPDDKEIVIYAARSLGGQNERNLEIIARRYPRDAFVVSLQIARALRGLRMRTLADAPTSPSAAAALIRNERPKWQKAIALARRGQRLEPNNTYFDWMLLYALYGVGDQNEARRVLRKAAHKTGWNSHVRDQIKNGIVYLKRLHGSPLSPLHLMAMQAGTYSTSNSNTLNSAGQVVKSVMSDRQNGKNDRALDTALDLMKLSRTLRQQGYSSIDSLVGGACESLALSPVTGPTIPRALRSRASLSAYRSHSGSLYFYAKAQGRNDLLPSIDAEWIEFGKWGKTYRKFAFPGSAEYSIGYSVAEAVGITAAQRLLSIILKTLPSILVVGAIFGLLSRRFRDGIVAPFALWRGAALGSVLLMVTMICDAAITLSWELRRQHFWLLAAIRLSHPKQYIERSTFLGLLGIGGHDVLRGHSWCDRLAKAAKRTKQNFESAVKERACSA